MFMEAGMQRIPSELDSLSPKKKNQAKILGAILVASLQFLCHEGNTMDQLKFYLAQDESAEIINSL